jgi:hypothetical protein
MPSLVRLIADPLVCDVGSDVNVLEGFRPALSRHNEPANAHVTRYAFHFIQALDASVRIITACLCLLSHSTEFCGRVFLGEPIPAVMTLDRN